MYTNLMKAFDNGYHGNEDQVINQAQAFFNNFN
jgi:hypothetical protein